MCGRYNIIPDAKAWMDVFDVAHQIGDIVIENPYNIAPSAPPPKSGVKRQQRITRVPIIRPHDGGGREGVSVVWPLIPGWAKGIVPAYATANARCETMHKTNSFRHAWKASQRCIIPASSFVEWQVVEGQKHKQPWIIHLADQALLAFAGLWERSYTEAGEAIESCTIVTAPANTLMAEIHNTGQRMPVILTMPEKQETWLTGSPEQARPLARPLPDGLLDAYPVSTRINNPGATGADLLDPVSLNA